MNMLMLAEITSNMDPRGVFCLAAIPCLIIVFMAYKRGFIAGAGTCFILLILTIFATNGALFTSFKDIRKHGFTNDFIANLNRTKFIEKHKCITTGSGCIFRGGKRGTFFRNDYNIKIPVSLDNYAVFIPEEELEVTGGSMRMISTLEPPVANDYYLYNKTYDRKNVPKEFGGGNERKDDVIPKWLYHPAAPTLIFGAGAIPGLLFMFGSMAFFGNRSKG